MLEEIRTHEQWRDKVLDGNLVLVEFFSKDDPFCEKAHDAIEEALNDSNGVKAYTLDTKAMKDITEMFAYKGKCSFMLFYHGIPKTLARRAVSPNDVERAIRETMNKTGK